MLLLALAPPLLLAFAAFLTLPPSASAAEAVVALSGAGLEIFERFLDQVAALGMWAPVAFITAVMCAEMVPFFPTQPLALSSGLLFGAKWGCCYQLLAVTLAAGNAFLVARGVGRSLAQRLVKHELGHSSPSSSSSGAAAGASSLSSQEDEEEEGQGRSGGGTAAAAGAADAAAAASTSGGSGSAAAGIARAIKSIEEGGPWAQFSTVLILRLTPVVPFSGSNYLIGLTPIRALPYLAGTVVGMAPWTALYASVGGASRRLLQRGVSVDVLMQDLSERVTRVSGDAAGYGAALLGAAAAAYGVAQLARRVGGGAAVAAAGAADGASASASAGAVGGAGNAKAGAAPSGGKAALPR
jgi:uncharacterized membrane protein YdjX (TVP38/TMEM64 family)